MSWLTRHAPSIEAVAASLTALVAIAALFGVKMQLDENDRLQRAASAREAYRSHLAMAVSNPIFAEPTNGCALMASDQAGAYEAFVDHLLYSAEQMLATEEGWQSVFWAHLNAHTDLVCSTEAPNGDTVEMSNLLEIFQSTSCPAKPTCE